MEPGKTVKCIDNSGIQEGRLTIGRLYVVVKEPLYKLSDTIYLANDQGYVAGYYKKRFVEVTDETV